MILKEKGALSIPYVMPASGLMQIRVFAEDAINIYAIPADALENYKSKVDFERFLSSSLTREYEFLVQLPPRSPWNLIIENPWDDRKVEVHYAATEMAPLPPVTISGSLTLPSPKVTGTIHVVGPKVTGSGTGTGTRRRGS